MDFLIFNIFRDGSEIEGNLIRYYNKVDLMNFISLTYLYETFLLNLIQKEKNSNKNKLLQNIQKEVKPI